jgi:hypothetical protein
MARALNLRKRLSNWVNKILVELSYHYIIQKAKQTSRKRDNFSSKEFLPSHLATEHRSITTVTSSLDTSEKTITILDDTDKMVDNIREWSISKIANIEPVGSKFAIYEEFEEWIELDDEESIEILSSGKKIVDKPLED